MSKSKQVLEDYLDEDPEVSGQKYALVSFISPENVLMKKDIFFFERFLQEYEIQWKVKNLEQFLAKSVTDINSMLSEHVSKLEKEGQTEAAEICRKSYIKVDDVLGTYQQFVSKNQKEINTTKLAEEYKDFMFKNQKKLEDEYHAKNDFQTSIRGFKVRGVVRDEHEAKVRVKKIQAFDKIHNIYLAEVGKWTPWDPAPSSIEDQEYAQDELNTLMKKYKENETQKDQFFEEQRKAGRKEGKQEGSDEKFMQIVKDDTPAPANTVVEGKPENVESMFNAPGDLALARKMENAKGDDKKEE